jgi:hypothetical protein
MPRRRFSRTSAEDHSGPLRVRTLEPLSPPRLTLRVAAALRGKPGVSLPVRIGTFASSWASRAVVG